MSSSPSPTPSPSAAADAAAAATTSLSLFEQLFPLTTVVDCSAASDTSARKAYACSVANDNLTVRLPITVLHLLSIFVIFMLAGLLYAVFLRVCERRLAGRLRVAPAARRLPVGRDVLSRRCQLEVFEGFAAATHDFSPVDFLLARSSERRRERQREGQGTRGTAADAATVNAGR